MKRSILVTLFGLMAIVLAIASAPLHSQEAQEPGREVSGVVRILGENHKLAGFPFVALMKSDTHTRRLHLITDESGNFSFQVDAKEKVTLFANGEFEIPRSWALIPDKDSSGLTIFARSRKPIHITGVVKKKGQEGGLGNVYIYFSPLDIYPDGSKIGVEGPVYVRSDEDGNFSIKVRSGYFNVWGIWTDTESDDYTPYFELKRELEFFGDTKVDLSLEIGPKVSGKVVDATNSKGVGAACEFFSGHFLNQPGVYCGDGSGLTDHPLGIFETRLRGVDHKKFDLFIYDLEQRNAIRILEDLDVAKLNEMEAIEIRNPAHGRLRLRVVTKDKGFPIEPWTISVGATGRVDVGSYLRSKIDLRANSDGQDGWVDFYGLPKGQYGVYASNRERLLSEIDVTGKDQEMTLPVDMPFLYGKISYPDGTLCEEARYQVKFKLADGYEGHPKRGNPYVNKSLAAKSLYFLPIAGEGSRNEITFGAMEKGVRPHWQYDAGELKFVADTITIDPTESKAYEINVKFKLNPNWEEPEKGDD